MGAGFHLDCDMVRARIRERFQVQFGFLDHQMHIQGQFGDAFTCFNDEWSHGDVGDESAIHHIHMDPVYAASSA